VFNSVALFPEVRDAVPSNNDDAFQFLMIQRGSQALADGENPIDHWSPELDLGAPRFLLYQNAPHLAVIFLDRLLLRTVSLLTLFNLTRYALLVGLPFTVYWSMRRMDFPVAAAAFGAAAAPLLSANFLFGFEYDSYVWRGFGMYTQLWAMHLSFIVLACLFRVVNRGTGYAVAVVACSLLVLSHLLYAEMMIVTAGVVFLIGLNRTNLRARVVRFGIVGGLTMAITAFFWVPFLQSQPYSGASPYEARFHFDSYGAPTVMRWLVQGKLLDFDRLPVFTAMLAIGMAAALIARTRQGLLAVALFVVWLVLYFGRDVWGPVTDRLPYSDILLFHRFIGGVQLAAILLIGVAGNAIWHWFMPLPERWRVVLAGLALPVLLIPALIERRSYYADNTQWMGQTADAIAADADARAILATLAAQPPGRTYAGLRENFGKQMQFPLTLQNSVRFSDLLTFYQIPAVSAPYQSISLSSDFAWHFDEQNAAHYQLFNVRYLIAPSDLKVPAFLHLIRTTQRYKLYQDDTSGYAEFASATDRRAAGPDKAKLFFANRDWLLGGDPAARKFIRWDYPDASGTARGPAIPGCADGGTISDEQVQPGRLDVSVACAQAATLVLKMSYHPNWRVTVDGHAEQAFMVSPGFIGVNVPAGPHHIRAEYRPGPLKTILLIVGACILAVALVSRRRLASLDAHFFSPRPPPGP
jgi:hypothetical protein